MNTVICPWCDYSSRDSWEFNAGEYDCDSCGKPMMVGLNVSVDYSTTRVENLDHDQL